MRDPIKEEIHKHREEHARKFNFDLAGICKDRKERSRNLNVVRLPPKKIRPKKRVRPQRIPPADSQRRKSSGKLR